MECILLPKIMRRKFRYQAGIPNLILGCFFDESRKTIPGNVHLV